MFHIQIFIFFSALADVFVYLDLMYVKWCPQTMKALQIFLSFFAVLSLSVLSIPVLVHVVEGWSLWLLPTIFQRQLK